MSGVIVPGPLAGAGSSFLPWPFGIETVPSVYDDEFDSSALDPAWTMRGTDVGTPIDPWIDFTNAANAPGTYKFDVHSHRTSWLRVQGAYYSGVVADPAGILNTRLAYGPHRSVTLPTNCFIYTRCGTTPFRGTLNSDAEVGLVLSATASGDVDFTKYFAMWLNFAISTDYAWRQQFVDGASNGGVSGPTTANGRRPDTMVGILKIGNTYRGAVGNDAGSWVWVASAATPVTITGLNRLFLAQIQKTRSSTMTTEMRCTIAGFDFVRVSDNVP